MAEPQGRPPSDLPWALVTQRLFHLGGICPGGLAAWQLASQRLGRSIWWEQRYLLDALGFPNARGLRKDEYKRNVWPRLQAFLRLPEPCHASGGRGGVGTLCLATEAIAPWLLLKWTHQQGTRRELLGDVTRKWFSFCTRGHQHILHAVGACVAIVQGRECTFTIEHDGSVVNWEFVLGMVPGIRERWVNFVSGGIDAAGLFAGAQAIFPKVFLFLAHENPGFVRCQSAATWQGDLYVYL